MSSLAGFLKNKYGRLICHVDQIFATGMERAARTYLLAADQAHTDAVKGRLDVRCIDIEIKGTGDRIDMKMFGNLARALTMVRNDFTDGWLYTNHQLEVREGRPPLIHATFVRRTGAPLPDRLFRRGQDSCQPN